MALSPRALNLFVDHPQRQDGSIAHELAALPGFVPLRFSPPMSPLAERMVGDLMHRLSQTEARS